MEEVPQEIPVLAVIQKVQLKQAGPSELLEAIEQVGQDLVGMRREFEEVVAQQPEVIRPFLAPEIEYVGRSLDTYLRCLDSLASYGQDFEAVRLQEGLHNLPIAASRLALDFERFREASLALRGPTTHPGVNLILTEAQRFLKGEIEESTFKETFDRETLRAGEWLEQDLSERNLGPELQAFYEQYLSLLQEPPAPEQVEEWLQSMRELGTSYARMDVDSLRRQYAYGPSPVTWLNMLVHAAWLVTQEQISPALLQDLILDANQELEGLAVGFVGWDASLDWFHQAGKLLHELHSWVGQLYEWTETADPTSLEELVQAGLKLAEQYPALLQKPGASDGATCSVCGTPVTGSKCAACGARIHAVAINPDEKAPESRVEQLLNQAQMVLREAGDVKAFEASFQALKHDLAIARAKDPGTNVPEEIAQLRERYLESLDAFEEALAELEEFSSTPTVEALEAAQEPLRRIMDELMQLQKDLAAAAS